MGLTALGLIARARGGEGDPRGRIALMTAVVQRRPDPRAGLRRLLYDATGSLAGPSCGGRGSGLAAAALAISFAPGPLAPPSPRAWPEALAPATPPTPDRSPRPRTRPLVMRLRPARARGVAGSPRPGAAREGIEAPARRRGAQERRAPPCRTARPAPTPRPAPRPMRRPLELARLLAAVNRIAASLPPGRSSASIRLRPGRGKDARAGGRIDHLAENVTHTLLACAIGSGAIAASRSPRNGGAKPSAAGRQHAGRHRDDHGPRDHLAERRHQLDQRPGRIDADHAGLSRTGSLPSVTGRRLSGGNGIAAQPLGQGQPLQRILGAITRRGSMPGAFLRRACSLRRSRWRLGEALVVGVADLLAVDHQLQAGRLGAASARRGRRRSPAWCR